MRLSSNVKETKNKRHTGVHSEHGRGITAEQIKYGKNPKEYMKLGRTVKRVMLN